MARGTGNASWRRRELIWGIEQSRGAIPDKTNNLSKDWEAKEKWACAGREERLGSRMLQWRGWVEGEVGRRAKRSELTVERGAGPETAEGEA